MAGQKFCNYETLVNYLLYIYTIFVGSDWDGVCGVPGIGKAADENAHKHWDQKNIENLGKWILKKEFSKCFHILDAKKTKESRVWIKPFSCFSTI